MIPPRFDRSTLAFRSVEERASKANIADIAVDPDAPPEEPGAAGRAIDILVERIRDARQNGSPVVLCYGAHLIKNGLGPVVIRLLEEGWVQHVATNGAGSIHDWEFGRFGRSCEDVRAYVAEGQFGIWEETGGDIGLALHLGALDGLGYGASIGRMMVDERLDVPARDALEQRIKNPTDALSYGTLAATADLLEAMDQLGIASGSRPIPHPFQRMSVQAACYRASIPFTVHPGIGQDIIYTHPLVRGGPLGRAAVADFLAFAQTIQKLSGGVYISAGSSVMSPMIFEKSLSMARNVARQEGRSFEGYTIAVNDLAPSTWDWSKGEPPMTNPAYYVRFCKSFSRMGGRMTYIGLDNRVFLTNLYQRLCRRA